MEKATLLQLSDTVLDAAIAYGLGHGELRLLVNLISAVLADDQLMENLTEKKEDMQSIVVIVQTNRYRIDTPIPPHDEIPEDNIFYTIRRFGFKLFEDLGKMDPMLTHLLDSGDLS